MKKAIDRIHRNLGHPSTEAMLRHFKAANATQEALQAVKDIKCDICDATREPDLRPRATLRKARHFNDRAHIDVHENDDRRKVLSIIDEATNFHIGIKVKSEKTEDILTALRKGWFRWPGLHGPSSVTAQQGSSLTG